MPSAQSSATETRESIRIEPMLPLAADVVEFKKRILEWPNPVEYVNNLYGCHPGDDNTEYFRRIFSK